MWLMAAQGVFAFEGSSWPGTAACQGSTRETAPREQNGLKSFLALFL